MPVLTLAEIASYATQLAGASLLDFSRVSMFVNVAYSHVLHERGVMHQERETTAGASSITSDARLAFPTDYDYAIGMKVAVPNSWSTATSRTTTWNPLNKMAATEVDCLLPDSTTSGVPTSYAEFATWFQLVPSPDSRYSIELQYVRRPSSNLTASTATPILDEQWHWAIVLKSAELLAAVNSDTTAEAANRGRYAQYVNRVRLDQTKRLMDTRGARVRYARSEQ